MTKADIPTSLIEGINIIICKILLDIIIIIIIIIMKNITVIIVIVIIFSFNAKLLTYIISHFCPPIGGIVWTKILAKK